MKYKVGDKVRIKHNLKEGSGYGCYVNDEMIRLKNHVVTISRLESTGGSFSIEEDSGHFFWTEGMFDLTYNKNDKPYFVKLDGFRNEWWSNIVSRNGKIIYDSRKTYKDKYNAIKYGKKFAGAAGLEWRE